MNVKYVKAGDKELPGKWTPRAKMAWEKSTNLRWLDIMPSKNMTTGEWQEPKVTADTEQNMKICYEVLKEGHRIEGKEFKLSFLDVVDLAGEFNPEFENQISEIVFGGGDEKK